MANGCEWRGPVAVCMSKRAAERLLKDIREFLTKAPTVDFNAEDWDHQLKKRQRYLKQRPWGMAADGYDLTHEPVPVRWEP